MDYRFGFNGMEKDDEVYNSVGSSYDFGARMYSSRLGRWNSVDPLAHDARQVDKSPYASMWNNPIIYKDPDGKIPLPVITGLIGAGVGAAKEISGQVASGMLRGEDFSTSLKKVDWFDVGVSTVEGAVLGATGAGLLGNTVSAPVTATISSAVDYQNGELRYVGGQGDNKKETKDFGLDFGTGMLGNSWGKLGKLFKSDVIQETVETSIKSLIDVGMKTATQSGQDTQSPMSTPSTTGPTPQLQGGYIKQSEANPDGTAKDGAVIRAPETKPEVVITPDED